MYDRLFLYSYIRELILAKGPVVINDFVDMGASASVEVGAAGVGAAIAAAQLCRSG